MSKKHLITSALPYINGIKHLGNLIGSLLPADVYARYLRQRGEEVVFICGTDEHGTPAELAAREANLATDVYCEMMYIKQKEVFQQFSIGFDYFGRSSSITNHNLTQEIFLSLDAKGLIKEKEIKQFFSLTDNRYLPDRYVIGTCPFCAYEKARGDQCESCGKLLDPIELITPYSAISGSNNLELRTTKHLFLDLIGLESQLQQWITSHDDNWNKVTRGIALKWLKEGLSERCISRDLEWGIKIPKRGYEDKVFYVWFDAPIAYISFTKEWAEQSLDNSEEWQTIWWNNKAQVNYTQFMAKDNIPFHVVFFPAILLGTEANWKLADNIKGFSWLTYEGGKFSTSSRRGVFLDDALSLFPADYWRYYLLANSPEGSDADFSFADFIATINKDLADVLGNLVSRVSALVHKYFESKVPKLNLVDDNDNSSCSASNGSSSLALSKVALTNLRNQLEEYLLGLEKSLAELKFRDAVKSVRKIWSLGNEYVAESKPWEYIKNDKQAAAAIIANCIYVINIAAISAFPFIPTIAQTVLSMVGSNNNPETTRPLEMLKYERFQAGATISKHQILVSKIDKQLINDLESRFAGRS